MKMMTYTVCMTKKSILAEMRRINHLTHIQNRKTINQTSKITEIELKHEEEITKQKEETIPEKHEESDKQSERYKNVTKEEMLNELRRKNRLASIVKADISFQDQHILDQIDKMKLI